MKQSKQEADVLRMGRRMLKGIDALQAQLAALPDELLDALPPEARETRRLLREVLERARQTLAQLLARGARHEGRRTQLARQLQEWRSNWQPAMAAVEKFTGCCDWANDRLALQRDLAAAAKLN